MDSQKLTPYVTAILAAVGMAWGTLDAQTYAKRTDGISRKPTN